LLLDNFLAAFMIQVKVCRPLLADIGPDEWERANPFFAFLKRTCP
jgi:hypothetical protein